ncbi:glycosyltransferase family 2 protein [Chryseobacterium salivictor]|uniref:Glycosyltransferase EpsH n=1 Tax=Chryseobacterium salivictor TaxID=2547600 RepID=A0A4P6ZFN5_9FLAO|nr:glycosyltransferase family 2 protein [Chryseobacterium salivictor]QBO58367.1 Putative glycosyltransferase EpsH [Chryseobacterium salivictor]
MLKISLIIPCYNVDQYISQCLGSVLAQTYPHLEIICVNDGSTDGTFTILEQFTDQDRRITIITQENSGIAEARNAGLNVATGDYIAFVDADDWLETDAFEKVLKDCSEDMICFSYYRNFAHGQLTKDLGLEGMFDSGYIQRRIIGLVDEEMEDINSFDALITCWGKLYKKETVAGIRFKDLKHFGTWEDGIFNIEVLEKARKVRVINKPLYHYRKPLQSTYTTNYKPELYLKWKNKFEWIRLFILVHDKPEIFEEALRNRISVTTLNLAFNEMNSSQSFGEKKANIKKILSDPLYVNAFGFFAINDIPVIWRIFYYFAKTENAFAVTLMADLIYRYINRKNK